MLNKVEAAIRQEYGRGFLVRGMLPVTGEGGALVLATDPSRDTTLGFTVKPPGPGEPMALHEAWRSTAVSPDFFDGTDFNLAALAARKRTRPLMVGVPLVLVALAVAVLVLLLVRGEDGSGKGGVAQADSATEQVAAAPDISDELPRAPVAPPVLGGRNTEPPGNKSRATPSISVAVGPPRNSAEGRADGLAGLPAGGEPVRAAPPPEAAAEDGLAAEQRVLRGVDDYVAAVRSREVARLRSAYPGITPAEVARWQAQFQQLRDATDVQATRHVERGPEINRETASVIFTLTLRYTTAAGEPKLLAMPLRAVFRRKEGDWRLDEVLALY